MKFPWVFLHFGGPPLHNLRTRLFTRISGIVVWRIFKFPDNVEFLNSPKDMSILKSHQVGFQEFLKANWDLSCVEIHKFLSRNNGFWNASGHDRYHVSKTSTTRILVKNFSKEIYHKSFNILTEMISIQDVWFQIFNHYGFWGICGKFSKHKRM